MYEYSTNSALIADAAILSGLDTLPAETGSGTGDSGAGQASTANYDVVDQMPNQPPQSDGYAQGAEQNGQTQNGNQNSANAAPQEPEYVAHIVLAQTYIVTDSGQVALEPGMAVTADVKTGRRRVISYLLSPFAHQIEEAGRER